MHFSVSFILLTQVRNLFMCTAEINLKLSLARNLLNIDLITCTKVLTKKENIFTPTVHLKLKCT